MPRKRTVQTPGAAPVADAETTAAQVADGAEQDSTDADAETGTTPPDDAVAGTPAEAGQSHPKPAKPARAESRELPDPSTLPAAVLTERGWLCPNPKPAA